MDIIEAADAIIEEATVCRRLGINLLDESHLSYKQIIATPDDALNEEQLSIKYQHCVWCKESTKTEETGRFLASARNGHQCWVHQNCSITK